MIERICQKCGRRFYVVPSIVKIGKGKFCSRKCSGKARYARVVRECLFCGTKFDARLDNVKNGRGKFCSRKCYYKWLRGENHPRWKEKIKRVCETCGKEFEVFPYCLIKPRTGRFCGRKCQGVGLGKSQSGENHWNWQGGLSGGRIGTLEWRRRVLKRDGYRCIICGEVGGLLNAHHIESWADNPELRFDIDNGISLCVECHAMQHPDRGALILSQIESQIDWISVNAK